MAVKLRLTRMGAKKKPTYRIVATDSRSPRDGQYLELIGIYQPVGECEVRINEELAMKWLNNGAIPTDTVKNLFSTFKIIISRIYKSGSFAYRLLQGNRLWLIPLWYPYYKYFAFGKMYANIR